MAWRSYLILLIFLNYTHKKKEQKKKEEKSEREKKPVVYKALEVVGSKTFWHKLTKYTRSQKCDHIYG